MTTVESVALGTERKAHVPGEVGIWVFIFGDLIAFSVFFAAFLVQWGQQPELFESSRENLTLLFAVINTVILLTSSLLVAAAVRASRTTEQRSQAPRLIALAIACAAAFVALKGLEYSLKVAEGITPLTNTFYMYFFMLTGIHLAHVLLGLIALLVMLRVTSRRSAREGDAMALEVSASYWHMVDLLWVVLFPVLYLLR